MSEQVSAIAEPMPENTRAMEVVITADISPDGWYMPWVDDALKEGLQPNTAEALQKKHPGRVEIRERAGAPQVVLTLPLTPESQEIVEHPERFWLTSMSGVSFSKFAVDVREVE